MLLGKLKIASAMLWRPPHSLPVEPVLLPGAGDRGFDSGRKTDRACDSRGETDRRDRAAKTDRTTD